MGYFGAKGKLIHKKNQKQNISWHFLSKNVSHNNVCNSIFDTFTGQDSPFCHKKRFKINVPYTAVKRKFWRDQVQSHIWLTASLYMVVIYWRISSYIRKPFLIYEFATDPIWSPSSYMNLQPIPSWIYLHYSIWGKFRFFISVLHLPAGIRSSCSKNCVGGFRMMGNAVTRCSRSIT